MNTLEGKVALVTGGSRGIGAQIARTLAVRGASVVLTYKTSEREAHNVVAEIEADGGQALALRADVADVDAGRGVVREIEARLGGLDVLVNNAGAIATASLQELTMEEFEQQFGVNVRGPLFLAQSALRIFRDGGRIVNISSVAAAGKFPTYSIYAASKAAVNAFTSVWARELGVRGITVNSVSPGPVETEMMRAVNDQAAVDAMAGMSPFGRVAQASDIADAVAFLCSHEARWITGRDLLVDGGLS